MAFQHFHLFNFLYKHKDAIDSFTSFASSAAGAASEVGGKYFEQIEEVLKDIERTYQSAFITRGTLIGEQFRVERAKHFKKLNILLNKFMKYKLGMSQYDDLRKALGLSSRSIMHRWSQSGVGGIEGYATYIDNSAKLVKAMKKLGYIGIALDFGNTTNNIYDACTVGRTSECKKKAFTEYGKFGASQTGNILGGGCCRTRFRCRLHVGFRDVNSRNWRCWSFVLYCDRIGRRHSWGRSHRISYGRWRGIPRRGNLYGYLQ